MPAYKLPSNQFDHFYKGGYRIGALRHGPGGPMRPEEWIGSTTTRFGEPRIGLSTLPTGELLIDALTASPEDWLGREHINTFGVSTELLVKLLDPDQRLPVHYHPNRQFAPCLSSLQAWQIRNIGTREKYQKGSRNWQLSVPKYCQLNELCPPAHKVEEPWRL